MIKNLAEIEHGAEIVIYGKGETGQELFAVLRRKRPDVEVKAFVDSYEDSGEICSTPIINVSEINVFEGCKIVIASMFYEEIARLLESSGYVEFSVFIKNNFIIDVYDDLDAINEGQMSMLDKLPDMDRMDCYYIINLGSGADAKNRVLTYMGRNDLSGVAHFFVTVLDYDYDELFKRMNAGGYDKFCIIDFDGRRTQLIGLARFLTCAQGKSVSIYKKKVESIGFSVLEGHKLLFLEVLKNGTSSTLHILDTLFEKDKLGRKRYQQLRQFGDVTDPFFMNYTKFAIVRNPYERLASLFVHVMRVAPDEFFYPAMSKFLVPFNFENFCRFVAGCPDEFADGHFKSQTSYFTLKGELRNDFKLLRMENYAEDIKNFFASIGEKVEVPHKNKSRPNKVDYMKDYYTPELIKLVNDRYRDDFINFGYEFL